MAPEFTLRSAARSDLPFLTHVFLDAMRDSISACRGGWDGDREQSQFLRQLDLAATKIIEDTAGKTIGFATVLVKPDAVTLHTLCVASEHQNQGAGTWVTRWVLREARSRDVEVTLEVLKVNEGAKRLYERLGFVVIKELENHLRMGFQSHRRKSGRRV